MADSSTIIQEKINVFCRLKPIGQQQRSESSCIKSCHHDGTCKYIKRSHDENEIPQEIVFPIRCFDQESHQEEIFHDVAKTICDSVIRGYNGTIMAYGPTNSGKTYTMRGNDSLQDIGIIPRCMKYILSIVHPDTIVMVSYLQIYCENISDLLDPNFNDSTNISTIGSDNYKSNSNSSTSSSPLQLRETMGRVYVEGLSSYAVNNIHDLQEILRKGDERRKTSSTNANLTSSRSHAILIIKVCQQNQANTGNSKTGTDTSGVMQQQSSQQSTLVLCDLAGSERATASAGLNFMRLEEAKAINLSLSALGNCMNALAEGKVHIPYRDSKLTRLLSNSLGGGSRTSIIFTVIPEEDAKGEYLNALRFASRASKVNVVANLVRYVDFEKLYNDTQKQLDEWEQEKRNKAIQLEEIQNIVEIKSNEIDMLHDEIRQLKSQLKLSSISSNNNNNNNSNNAGGTESDSNNNYNSDNNANTNKSVCNSIECESLRQQIITDYSIEIEKLRASLNTKIKKEQSTILTLEQEIQELSIDFKHDRENHLSTITDMKRINEIKNQIEIQCQERIQEIYSELDNKNTILEEKNEIIEKYQHQQQHQVNKNKSTSSSSSNGQDNNGDDDSDMISKSKMIEMEKLFMITVEKLSNRLHQLEMSKANGNSSNNNTNNNNNSRQQPQSLGSSSSSGSRNNLLNNNNIINNGETNHTSLSKHPLKKALDYSNGR